MTLHSLLSFVCHVYRANFNTAIPMDVGQKWVGTFLWDTCVFGSSNYDNFAEQYWVMLLR